MLAEDLLNIEGMGRDLYRRSIFWEVAKPELGKHLPRKIRPARAPPSESPASSPAMLARSPELPTLIYEYLEDGRQRPHPHPHRLRRPGKIGPTSLASTTAASPAPSSPPA